MEMCALKLVAIVDRHLLILSTIFFFAAVVRSVIALRARLFRRSRFNFVMIALGFALQTPISSLIGWFYIIIRSPYKVGDRIQVGKGRRGPVAEALQKEFFGIVTGSKPDHYGWLSPVYANQPVGAK